jgi:F420H(2)-dependent quinone reductase
MNRINRTTAPRKPPAWFIHTAWRVHRALHKVSGGRFLWTTTNKRGWGAMRLTAVGRRSGQPRSVIVGYIEDGPNLVTLAMNGWDEGHPSWWHNLQAHPEARVKLAQGGSRQVRAREAAGAERERLWRRWGDVDPHLTAHAPQRATATPVVVLEPIEKRCP